jgi:hypothetical protein
MMATKAIVAAGLIAHHDRSTSPSSCSDQYDGDRATQASKELGFAH